MKINKQSSKQSQSSKEGLKSLLSKTKTSKKQINDINDAIKVDSQLLNYGVVNPCKLLGSILMVSNLSSDEQTINLSTDTANDIYDKNEIIKCSEFEYLEELVLEEMELSEKELKECSTEAIKESALEKKKRFIPNSETSYDCWFIENPKTKELTK